MKITNTTTVPPGGYRYREIAINWTVDNPFLPIDMVISEIQMVRSQNLHVGLDPSREAVEDALGDQVYANMSDKNRPKYFNTLPTPSLNAPVDSSQPARRQRRCAGCGGR